MATLDEVQKMQNTGMSESQIFSSLKSRGISDQEISNALSQGKIKQAVGGATPDFLPPSAPGFSDPMPPEQFQQASGFDAPFQGQNSDGSYSAQGNDYSGSQQGAYSGMTQAPNGEYAAQGTGDYSGMQPSMITQDQYYGTPGTSGGAQDYTAAQPGYQDPYAGAYSSYQPYQETLNTDVIGEIAEQIVSERLNSLQDKFEKIIDMKNVVEANMSSMNDRLRRMEAIVDQMQISLLKKVGDYLSDAVDLKQELQETQKSFVSIQKSNSRRKK